MTASIIDVVNAFRLDGKRAMIVGAASGIGKAIALGFAASGAATLCADLNLKLAEKTVVQIRKSGGVARSVAMDVTSISSVNRAVRAVVKRDGGIDALVITPGINIRKPLIEFTIEEFDKVMEINLKGNFLIAQAVAREMRDQGSGSILFISSIRSAVVEPGMGVYGATKAGIVQLARGFAAELGKNGVRVNCLAPGIVKTPLSRPIWENKKWRNAYAKKTVLGRWASTSEMVGPALFLASDASSYVTGAVLFADGGWTAVDGRFVPPV